MNRSADKTKQNGSDDFVARAKRAMLRASDRAMADYERFEVEPVISGDNTSQQAPKKT